MPYKLLCFSALTWLLLCSGPLATASEGTRFERDVLPLLYHHCFACHSEKQSVPKGDLRLDSVEGFLKSKVIVPGKPDESELLARVSLPHSDESAMPPVKGGAQPLNDAERAVLRQWISDGAPFGQWIRFEHRGPIAPAVDARIASADIRQLSEELQSRIDQWHKTHGTQLNKPIDEEAFLRRVYLDVIGRIPSLEESDRFLDDKDADKREKLIDELLRSEGYVSHMFNWKADLLRVNTRGLAQGQPGKLYDDWIKNAIRSRMPYDEFVRQLITASGYLWENGAVGFYLRDIGMPLDHMSNMTRVFLGTRIECAQCHDHPLEPITQNDFYQMVAFTYGVTNLGSPAGYSTDYVKQYAEIKTKLASMEKDLSLEQSLSSTVAPLKRLTKDTDKQLMYPETFVYDEKLRGQPVEPQTLFGDKVEVNDGNRRQAFAAWMTSPRNPRFAKNIANRLWKRIMGVGLVEPVDSLSVLPDAEHGELLDFLSQMMIRLNFDERDFLRVVLNTPLYQSEAVRESLEPGAPFALRGPQLRRLSAEQIWDSSLVLVVKDLDERKSNFTLEGILNPQYLQKLTAMTADEIIAQARIDRVEHTRRRAYSLRLAEQQKERAAAQSRGDLEEVKRLNELHAQQNKQYLSSIGASMDSSRDGTSISTEADRVGSLCPVLLFALRKLLCLYRSATF